MRGRQRVESASLREPQRQPSRRVSSSLRDSEVRAGKVHTSTCWKGPMSLEMHLWQLWYLVFVGVSGASQNFLGHVWRACPVNASLLPTIALVPPRSQKGEATKLCERPSAFSTRITIHSAEHPQPHSRRPELSPPLQTSQRIESYSCTSRSSHGHHGQACSPTVSLPTEPRRFRQYHNSNRAQALKARVSI